MGKLTKTNKRTKTVKRRNRNTKLRYKGGLPHQCTGEYTLTQFGINDVQIQSFRRNVLSPKDCVINALQLIGMLDIYTANLLRITLVGQFGIDQSQIEQIFILYYGYTFISCLQVGHVAFAGYQDVNGAKHVFLIGRKTDGHVYYIDPQINQICNLSDPQCLQYIANKQFFFLLKNNQTKLTDAEFRSKGFVNVSGGNDVNVGDVVMDTSA